MSYDLQCERLARHFLQDYELSAEERVSDEMSPEVDCRGGGRGKYFSQYWRWVLSQTNPCTCAPRIVVRQQPEWNPAPLFYGYGVAVTVRVHMGACPLTDEVLETSVVKWKPENQTP